MRLVTYSDTSHPERGARLGRLDESGLIDVGDASGGALPDSLLQLLRGGPAAMAEVAKIAGDRAEPMRPEIGLLAPLPHPPTLRDCMAHEKHVTNIAELRGVDIPDVWYQQPVFYFSNPMAIRGPHEPVWAPPGCNLLDLELEVAFVISREGIDIKPESAFDHVAGFMLLNDWSARDLQMVEMLGRLGPAKGKDFATSIGPWLLTTDEVRDRIDGEKLALEVSARINGKALTRGSLGDLYHTIPRIIEHVSRGVRLYPGEIIGTGTVGGGCLLEHADAEWLKPGDVVELEGEGLGVLSTPIVSSPG